MTLGEGARALEADAQPKYLNSPETRLFDKGSMVYNFARARTPAFEKNELIVVEGYMDVIALHQAGFKNVVATLGTAFTERQMEILWHLAPEPVICFDGDRAGEGAAALAVTGIPALVMPSIEPFDWSVTVRVCVPTVPSDSVNERAPSTRALHRSTFTRGRPTAFPRTRSTISAQSRRRSWTRSAT